MITPEYLTTRRDFERAKTLVLQYFHENSIATRRELSNFRIWGLTYEAIELAIRDLKRKGIIEELYVLPQREQKAGQRPEYYGLITALDSHAAILPQNVIREKKAFELIADTVRETV